MTLIAKCKCGIRGLGDCPESCVWHENFIASLFMVNKEKSYPEDSHLENGNYLNICSICGDKFTGYKRRVVCKECNK